MDGLEVLVPVQGEDVQEHEGGQPGQVAPDAGMVIAEVEGQDGAAHGAAQSAQRGAQNVEPERHFVRQSLQFRERRRHLVCVVFSVFKAAKCNKSV